MRALVALFALPIVALLGCGGATCPAGAKLDHGTCVRTIVETRVECPRGQRMKDGSCFGENVAKVDFVAVFIETFEAKALQERLRIVYEKHQKDLDERTAELKRDKDELDKKMGGLSPAAREKESADFARRMDELQKLFIDYQKDLQDQQTQALKEGLETSRPRLERMAIESAKAEGFGAVFETCANPLPESVRCDASKPIWIAEGLDATKLGDGARWDLTPSVIGRYKQDLAGK